LLERAIENVTAVEIKEIALVVGYRAEMIREFVKRRFPQMKFRIILNPNYASTNNAYSLFLARRFLLEDHGRVSHRLLLLDSDILFSNKLLPYVLSAAAENKIAVRRSGEHNEEEVQVDSRPGGNIYFIGKRLTLNPQSSESIGIELFSEKTVERLFAILEEHVRSGIGRSEFYEAAFQEMIDRGDSVMAVDVSVFPAMEIDTKEDFEQAQQLLLM